jgi:predicted Rossmann fold flavoprotein
MKASASSKSTKIWDVIVIGGGPSGMMAAGRAAERGLSVLLIEKNEGLGKKLLITGGGRCNVTNAEFDDRALLTRFKDDGKFLFSAFSQYSVKQALDFFHVHSMQTKTEAEKRVFPLSNTAKSVWDVLVAYMKAGDVTLRSKAKVTGFVETTSAEGMKSIQAVKISGGETIAAKHFVLATGGTSHPETGSTGEGFDWLRALGHTVAAPSAALVPITVAEEWVKKLSGVSLPMAKITLFQNGVKQAVNKGKVLFTHFGLSGPGILNMSAEVSELMKYGDVLLSLDLLPDHDYSKLNEALQRLFSVQANKKFKNAIGGIEGIIPAAFVSAVLEVSGINGDTECNSVTREERLNLVKILKAMPIKPTGFLGAEKAIITAGGVALTEVDFKTMQSRLVSNLSLVGDVLDIDRPSGGYSLQLCWTTGWVAGNSVGN